MYQRENEPHTSDIATIEVFSVPDNTRVESTLRDGGHHERLLVIVRNENEKFRLNLRLNRLVPQRAVLES